MIKNYSNYFNNIDLKSQLNQTNTHASYLTTFVHPSILHLQRLFTAHHIELSNIIKNVNSSNEELHQHWSELRAIIEKIQNAIITLQINNNNVNGRIDTLEDQLNKELPRIIKDNLVQLGIPEDFAPSLSKIFKRIESEINDSKQSYSSLETDVRTYTKLIVQVQSSINDVSNSNRESREDLQAQRELSAELINKNRILSERLNQAEEKEKINQKKIESLENNFMAISKALANLQELFYQNMDCLESRVNNRLNLLKDQVSDYSNLSSTKESNQSRIGNLESDILKLESRLAENSRRQLNKTENSDKPLRTRILELEKKVETIENKIYLNVCRCKSTPIISSPKDQYYDIEADSVGKSTPCQHSPGICPQPENIFIMHPTPENTFSNLDNVFSDSHPTQPNNKPINLPKFDINGNLHTFLRLFENSMSKASNADKAAFVVSWLDTASIELFMPHFTTNH